MNAIKPYPIFIFINYVMTFLLFPNLTVAKKTNIEAVWSTLLFLLMYNVGDFVGKIIGDFRNTFNSMSMTFLLFSRLYFFYTIPLMD